MNLRGLIIFFTSVFAVDGCRNLDVRRAISYRLIKADARSQLDVMTRRRVPNVAKCMDFAENKQALAFNFAKSMSAVDPPEANCILLFCPETRGLTDLANVTGVDYYSAYPNVVHAGNVSLACVEKVGLFARSADRQNFTNARATCRRLRGYLADVASEPRTRVLGQLLPESPAHVGLSNQGDGERIWKNELGDPLACFEYRAWDSGEPSHSRGCVGLVQTDRTNDSVWRVMSCAAELPYVCEIPRLQEPEETQEMCSQDGMRVV